MASNAKSQPGTIYLYDSCIPFEYPKTLFNTLDVFKSLDPEEFTNYEVYSAACLTLMSRWLNQSLPNFRPLLDDKELIMSVYNGCSVPGFDVSENVVDFLIDNGVLAHWIASNTHRLHIASVCFFLQSAGCDISQSLVERCKFHDLSKYLPEETFGYARRFFKHEQDEFWTASLAHHYAVNPHHPQYYGFGDQLLRAATTADENGVSIVPTMEPIDLDIQETAIDYLSCTLERDMRKDESISLSRWIDVDRLMKFTAYTGEPYDKLFSTFQEWRRAIGEFIATTTIVGGPCPITNRIVVP